MTVGKKALSIGFDNIGWLDGLENGPDDYCAHAHAVTAAPFGEYREEVLAFADKVEAFYDGSRRESQRKMNIYLCDWYTRSLR